MNTFRYKTVGPWFKGNTHIHSTASDGGKTFAELAEMYAGAGYDFLCRTDHWVASDAAADTQSAPLLWLDGVELDGHDERGSYYHVVCLGRMTGVDREMGFVEAMAETRRQGAMQILAHPQWSGNTTEDVRRWDFHGVEIYNHVCRWINGKSDGMAHWNMALEHKPGTLGLAVDDAHLRAEHPIWNGGWVMVNAAECTSEAVMAALWAGRFYATCGPEFHSIALAGDDVTLTTSPVQAIRLVGASSAGMRVAAAPGEDLTSATFAFPTEWPYAYLEIEDDRGRRARTNSLMVAER